MAERRADEVGRLSVYVGEARLDIECSMAPVLRGLDAVWRSARAPVVAVTQRHLLQVSQPDPGAPVEVHVDGLLRDTAEPAAALPVAERAIYTGVPRWFADTRALLHAALLEGPAGAVLLLGESGAGKSSLARAGLTRGYRYGADELCFSDGERLWGAPRSVLFEPTRVGNPLPPVAAGADQDAYTFVNWHGDPCFLPICPAPPSQLMRNPVALARTHIVLLSRSGRPGLAPATPLDVLGVLHAECRGRLSLLGAALRPERCHRLCWQRPDSAWQHLAELVGTPRLAAALSCAPTRGGDRNLSDRP